MSHDPDIVTASQIGEYRFCPEAARLSMLGVPSANRPQREAGTGRHEVKATAEVAAGGSIDLGRFLIAGAALALLALAAMWALGR